MRHVAARFVRSVFTRHACCFVCGFSRPYFRATPFLTPRPSEMNAITSAKPFRLVVKAVILDGQQRCLLLRRSAFNHNFAGCWEWPGGKVDGGEDFATALLREAREETGLVVQITGLAGAITYEMAAAHMCASVHGNNPCLRELRLRRGAR